MSRQLSYVVKKRFKAFRVFEDAKKKLLETVEDAEEFKSKNSSDIENLNEEMKEKSQINLMLDSHILYLNNSITEIDQIINPR